MSILFDGVNDNATCATCPVTTYPISMCAWVKRGATDAARSIFELNAGASADRFSMILGATNLVLAQKASTAVGASAATTVTTLTDTAGWHHIACVWTNSTTAAVYLDGANKATSPTSSTPANVTQIIMGTNFSNANDYNGRIAAPAIWGVTALTDAEVATLATLVDPRAVQLANLKSYWPTNASSTVGVDIIGGFNLTLNNQAAFDSDQPAIAAFLPPFSAYYRQLRL